MKSRFSTAFFCAALAALALLTACATSGYGEVYADVAPPAAVVEVRGVAPGPDYVWIDGYHRWDGHHYYWNKGRWDRPPRAGFVWVPGHWEQTSRGWHWIEGQWR